MEGLRNGEGGIEEPFFLASYEWPDRLFPPSPTHVLASLPATGPVCAGVGVAGEEPSRAQGNE